MTSDPRVSHSRTSYQSSEVLESVIVRVNRAARFSAGIFLSGSVISPRLTMPFLLTSGSVLGTKLLVTVETAFIVPPGCSYCFTVTNTFRDADGLVHTGLTAMTV